MIKPSLHPTESTPELIQLLQKGLHHQKIGEMENAEKNFQLALKVAPDNSEVIHIAAIFYDQIQNNRKARALLEKISAKSSNDFGINYLLGKVLLQDGEFEKARMHLMKSLSLKPHDAEINGKIGLCYYKEGKYEDAISFFKSSLKNKNSVPYINKLGKSFIFLGRYKESIEILQSAINHNSFDYDTLVALAYAQKIPSLESQKTLMSAILAYPEKEEAKALFGLFFEQGITLTSANAQMEQILALCLESENVNHTYLANFWGLQIFSNPENEKARSLLTAKNYQDFLILYQQPEHQENLLQYLFILGIKKIPVSKFPLENLLCHLRRYYLHFISRQNALGDREKEFLQALSLQMFFSEFLFTETDTETQTLDNLRNIEENPEELLIYSCYRPLDGLETYADILKRKSSFPTYLHEIINVHIEKIIEEKNARKTILSIGNISNKISQDVQIQYEENPYPRWRTLNFFFPLTNHFPDDASAKAHKTLIAGCGTGKHALTAQLANPKTEITAIDLSRSSLAYASIKAKEYGIKNIKFFQADILDLEKIEERFDSIESIGVLHHMENPSAGLKVLINLLKDDGEITLGLYSEHARQNIVKARDFIKEKNYSSDLKGMRACREYIKQHAESYPFLLNAYDFYTASGCRDLIFHKYEIQYTIPKVKNLLKNNNLEFSSFVLPAHKIKEYKDTYSEKDSITDLNMWDEFEQKNSDFFSGMYIFKCKKIGVL